MPRSSKQDTAKHRQQVIEGASELFRERGIDGVNVGELMGAAGLTHGGFYRHFASKDELAGLAAAHAIAKQAELLGDERAFIEGYLSPEHRDDVAHGCVVSALGPELARADEPVREAFVEAYRAFVERFGDDEQALAKLSTMVGALVIARVAKGDPLSDEVLAAARDALLG
jgi:TetR/AcrR family transcriptional regulator, transcriptional repressor for nem operon